jgi:hypothetical protein
MDVEQLIAVIYVILRVAILAGLIFYAVMAIVREGRKK